MNQHKLNDGVISSFGKETFPESLQYILHTTVSRSKIMHILKLHSQDPVLKSFLRLLLSTNQLANQNKIKRDSICSL